MKNDCSYVLPVFAIKSRVIRTVNTLNSIIDIDLSHLLHWCVCFFILVNILRVRRESEKMFRPLLLWMYPSFFWQQILFWVIYFKIFKKTSMVLQN